MAIRVGISDAAACSICADPNVETLSGSVPANRLRDHHEIIHQTGVQRSENALPACRRVAHAGTDRGERVAPAGVVTGVLMGGRAIRESW